MDLQLPIIRCLLRHGWSSVDIFLVILMHSHIQTAAHFVVQSQRSISCACRGPLPLCFPNRNLPLPCRRRACVLLCWLLWQPPFSASLLLRRTLRAKLITQATSTRHAASGTGAFCGAFAGPWHTSSCGCALCSPQAGLCCRCLWCSSPLACVFVLCWGCVCVVCVCVCV